MSHDPAEHHEPSLLLKTVAKGRAGVVALWRLVRLPVLRLITLDRWTIRRKKVSCFFVVENRWRQINPIPNQTTAYGFLERSEAVAAARAWNRKPNTKLSHGAGK